MQILSIALSISSLFSAPNPVLPGVADAGVLRHAGKYYIMGVGTHGGVYVSDDLINWDGPHHAFSMKNAWATGDAGKDSEIHACDLVLHNGRFHLYWSVNYQELRQIGHAVSDVPLGPYTELSVEEPFDGRIDPQLFVDHDGSLYFYTVKFGLGNIIFGQRMSDPYTLVDEPKMLLTPLAKTWETLDNLVNEAPFVIGHRDRYYLLYNANHTAPEYGNYAIGVAEAEAPMAFSNKTKYPFPVIRSNRDLSHAGKVEDKDTFEVKNAGQPNLVRGPNGFDWWLVYFADHERRSQCIDRVHFFGRELYIEGPTRLGDAGYFPAPAKPSFQDSFADDTHIEAHWEFSGDWQLSSDRLSLDASKHFVRADVREPGARHYLVETVLHFSDVEATQAGLVVWRDGANRYLSLVMDRESKHLYWHYSSAKGVRTSFDNLPEDLRWDGPQVLRVENNGGVFQATWSGVRLPGFTIPADEYGVGTAGVFVAKGKASFDHFSMTRGWEEWGTRFNGWKADGAPLLSAGKRMNLKDDHLYTKGDLLASYECSVQLSNTQDALVYPVYIDEHNYLRCTVNTSFDELRVTGAKSGEPVEEAVFAIEPRVHRAHPAAENGNNVRFVKQDNQVIIFAEGRQVAVIPGTWPASRIALSADGGELVIHAVTMTELP